MSYLGSKTSNLDPVINYISNGRAYNSTEGWSTYAESDAVTFQDTGDTVTLNSHGLQNGNVVSFTSITSTTGISINTTYYVVSATTNTFQVASSAGGSALPLTTNGSGTMVRFVPKLGTGGSPNLTFTRSTTSPLRQGADFNLVKDAANRMGQGVSYDFTIDNADLAKVLTITFDYEVVSGTYASGDIDIFLIQDPTGTPVVIQPTGYVLQAGTVGTKLKAIATFQTSNSATSYRLSLHVSSTSTSAYTLAIDNVVVGPQVVQYGAPVTDWQSYTPSAAINQGFGTLSSIDLYWRRVGGNIEIRGSFTTGTVTASEARLALPNGLVTTTDVNQNTIVGNYGRSVSSTAHGGFIVKQHGVGYLLFSDADTFSGATTIARNPDVGVGVATNGELLTLFASVPILGWSSTVQMSNDTDTRVVAASAAGTATGTLNSSYNNIVFPTVNIDTHGGYNASTGVYTVQVPGQYLVTGAILVNGTYALNNALSIALSKNNSATYSGVGYNRCGGANNIQGVSLSATIVSCNAGDTLQLKSSFEGSSGSYNSTPGSNFFSVTRISGPSAIAANETVAARYYTSAGPTINNTTPVITYGTKVFDTHGAMSGNTYTIPVSGKYWFHMHVYTASTAYTAASFIEGLINKNGVLHSFLFSKRVDAAVTAPQGGNGSCIVDCSAGDTIQFRVGSGVSTTLNTTFTDSANYVDIYRVGN
jgi:hypothetical protein